MSERVSQFDRAIVAFVSLLPKGLVFRFAKRYVAGRTLDDGVRVTQRLMTEGCCATFDLLGEFINNLAEGRQNVDAYLGILDRIHAEGLDANVSVKLTAFGLLIDKNAALDGVRRVVAHAKSLGNFVRIDMEDSPCTDATLEIYRTLKREGFDNVGVAIQAYMRRTQSDLESLAEIGPNFRLCKGIYVEPEKIAFKGYEEVRASYRRSVDFLLKEGSRYVGIASHDDDLIDYAEGRIAEWSVPKSRYEFQMLLGVADPRRKKLVENGHRMRVYVPFGEDWYGYSMRRLKENPRIGRYILLSFFGR